VLSVSVFLCPVGGGAGKFHNGTGRELGGSFVELYDPFGECRFSLVEVSLVYDVLPAVEIFASRFFSMAPLLFFGIRR
jgi:hypothetical protein